MNLVTQMVLLEAKIFHKSGAFFPINCSNHNEHLELNKCLEKKYSPNQHAANKYQ